MIKQERLKELLNYDPTTGVFTWVAKRSGVHLGSAGGAGKDYARITVDGKTYPSHRLAWLYMTGDLVPAGLEIDHIDGDKLNNVWSNLRLASRSENSFNKGITKINTSGIKGLSKRDTRYWKAQLNVNHKIFSKHFPQTEEGKSLAIQWLEELRAKFHGEFANNGGLV
jgi:hypothetical protein